METTLSDMFNKNKLDISGIEETIGMKIEGLTFGMTPFQINHFVLNKQEFPTPYSQFLQARIEIYTRVNTFIDFYYQYRECLAKIRLAEGRIQQMESESNEKISWSQAQAFKEIKEARLELQRIEIEKNRLRLNSIQSQAEDKMREIQVFYETYKKHRHFETDPPEEIQMAEEEYWKTKSGYYPELRDRYGLTPAGFLTLPHENGGLETLIRLTGGNNAKTIDKIKT